MKLEKIGNGICFFIGVAITLVMFFTTWFLILGMLTLGSIAMLPYFMTSQYQFAVALHRYELESALISALRSARMFTGRGWMELGQVVKAVEHKLKKRYLQRDCIIVLNDLITKEVVGVGELLEESVLVYRLIDNTYLPQMPEKIEVVREKSRRPIKA